MTRNSYLVAAAALAIVIGSAVIWWSNQRAALIQQHRTSDGPDTAISADSPSTSVSAKGTTSPETSSHSMAPVASATPKNGNSAIPLLVGPAGTPLVTSVVAVPSDNVQSTPPSLEKAMIGLDKTQRMIRDFNTLMGENPVGTNAEIMKAIMGGNARQAILGPGEGQQLNNKGELVDQWSTPYFFHQLSGNHMEIHSAGPDKIMGTDDDLILK